MNHYVYFHWDDDELVYIGKGVHARAWNITGKRLHNAHGEWMKTQLPHLNVEIYAENLTEAEALSLEGILIAALTPKYNTSPVEPRAITNGDKVYYGIKHAAKCTGIPYNNFAGFLKFNRHGWNYV